jgi:hypothetical protein
MTTRLNQPAYLLGIYWTLVLSIRLATELTIRNFVQSLGFGEDELSRFVFDNEMNLQAFSLVLAMALVAWIVKPKFFQMSEAYTQWKRFFVLCPKSELFSVFSESGLKAFLVASLGIGLSIFLGFSTLERPSFAETSVFALASGILIQGILLFTWILLIELQRYFFFKAWVEVADASQQSTRFYSEALLSRVICVGFESVFYFFVLNSSFFWLERFYVGLLCFLMAAGQWLWMEQDARAPSLRDQRYRALRRTVWVFAFCFSLIHIFGQSVGGYKRVSWMSTFPGPLREPTGNLASSSPAGQILFALLLVLGINYLIRKVLLSSRQ